MAVDLGHLFVAHNELQNAADAGALAGARFLYTNNGHTINVNANQVAFDAATANISESTSVEVNEPLTNYDDVQRGHWSFGLGNLERGFYRSDNTTPSSTSIIKLRNSLMKTQTILMQSKLSQGGKKAKSPHFLHGYLVLRDFNKVPRRWPI